MSPFPVATKSRRLLLLVFLVLVLAWAGGSSARADEPAPSLVAPDLEAFLVSDADCAPPTANTAELPELFPAPQPKSGWCSPYCGYTGCRGVLVGSICTKATGGQGSCYGPPMGKTCADGLPMCLCV